MMTEEKARQIIREEVRKLEAEMIERLTNAFQMWVVAQEQIKRLEESGREFDEHIRKLDEE